MKLINIVEVQNELENLQDEKHSLFANNNSSLDSRSKYRQELNLLRSMEDSYLKNNKSYIIQWPNHKDKVAKEYPQNLSDYLEKQIEELKAWINAPSYEDICRMIKDIETLESNINKKLEKNRLAIARIEKDEEFLSIKLEKALKLSEELRIKNENANMNRSDALTKDDTILQYEAYEEALENLSIKPSEKCRTKALALVYLKFNNTKEGTIKSRIMRQLKKNFPK